MKRPGATAMLIAGLLLLWASAASAQEETPQSATQLVRGTIVNQTTHADVPAGLATMLHVWDQSGAALGMLHGVSGPMGEVMFPDVEVVPDAYYGVMVVYNDGTYLSEPYLAQAGQEVPAFEIDIFESTDDASALTVDTQHIFFTFSQGGLGVAEIYSLSNTGELTVAGAVAIEGDARGTLAFPLPERAANVSFPGASGARFQVVTGGFVDTMPLVPGEGTGSVVVSYVMPYQDSMTFERQSPFDIGKVAFLVPHAGALTLMAEGAIYEGPQQLGGNEVFDAYSLKDVRRGSPVKVLLSGAPPEAPAQIVAGPSSTQGDAVAIGLGLLGLALIAAGIWWWRRGHDEPELEEAIEGSESEARDG